MPLSVRSFVHPATANDGPIRHSAIGQFYDFSLVHIIISHMNLKFCFHSASMGCSLPSHHIDVSCTTFPPADSRYISTSRMRNTRLHPTQQQQRQQRNVRIGIQLRQEKNH